MANRFWVGGSGTWNTTNTANWSATSGGASGATVPTSADAVIFDGNSGTGTITFAQSQTCLSITGTGSTFAIAGVVSLSVAGSITTPATFDWSGTTGTITITAASTLTIGSTVLPNITINAFTGVIVQLGAALTCNNTITHTQGTFTTNNNTLELFQYIGTGASTKVLNLGSSQVNVSYNGTGSAWDASGSGLTLNAGTSTISFRLGSSYTITFGTKTYYNVNFDFLPAPTSGTIITTQGANTFNNLSLRGTSASSAYVTYTLANTQTVTGTFSTNGTSPTNRIILRASTLGLSRTVSAAAVSLADIDFSDITGTGTAAPFTGTRLGNLGANSGITFTTKTVYWNLAGTQNWSATAWASTSGGAPNVNNFPLPQDTAIFDNTGAAGTVTVDLSWNMPNLNMSARTSPMTFSFNPTMLFFGNFICNSSVTYPTLSIFNFVNRVSQTFTQNGATLSGGTSMVVDNNGGETALGSAANFPSTLQLITGNLNLVTYTLTGNTFTSSGTGTRGILFGTGNITVTGTGTVWNTGTTTGLTVTGTPVVNITDSTASAITVTPGSYTGGVAKFNRTAGTGTFTITATSTIDGLDFTGFAGTWATTSTSNYGGLVMSTGMALSGNNQMTFLGTGTNLITSNGKTYVGQVTFSATTTGTYQLTDAFTTTNIGTLTAGTLDLNGKTFTCTRFIVSGTGTKSFVSGTGGNIVVTSTGVVFDFSSGSGMTTTGNPVVNVTNATATACTVAPGSVANGVASFNFTAGTYALTLSAGNVKDLNFTGWAGTVTLPALSLYGSLTIPSTGGTYTGAANTLTFAGTSGTQVINTNGRALDYNLVFNGIGGTFQLGSNISATATKTASLTAGTLNLNNFGLTTGIFASSNANTRTLAFGTSGVIALLGNAATVWNTNTSTNLSVTGTSRVNLNYALGVGIRTIDNAGASPIPISFNITAGTDTVTIATGSAVNNLDFTGFSGTFSNNLLTVTGNFTASTGMTLAAGTNTVSFAGSGGTQIITSSGKTFDFPITINNATGTVQLSGNLTSTGTRQFSFTAGTLDLNNNNLSCGLFASNVTSTRAILFGTGQINLIATSSTLITFDGTNYSVTGSNIFNATAGGAGTRSISIFTASGSEAVAPNINVTAGTDIVDVTGKVKNLNFTGFSGTLTNTTRTIYGNLTISTGMTLTAGALTTTFAGTSGTQVITSNGKTHDYPITFNGAGGTFQLADNLTTGNTRVVTLTNGTLDLNSNALTTGIFSSSNSNARTLAFGTGQIYVTGNAATVWDIGNITNITTSGSKTVNATYSGATGTRTLAAGGNASNNFSFNVSAGTDTVTFANNSLVNSIDFTGFAGTLSNVTVNIYGNLNISAGMTLTPGTSAFQFANSGTKTITTNGKTLDFPVTFGAVGGVWQFQDALTLGATNGSFTFSSGTIQFKAGTTNTVSSFILGGTTLKYLRSTTPGTQATISQASGTVTATYLDIQDSNATGGATWDALPANGNVNSGNNTGWNFAGIVFTADITESLSTSEIQDFLYQAFVNITESSTATDAQSTSWVTSSAITESSTATATQSTSWVTSSAIVETATLTDTQNAGFVLSASLGESVSISDVQAYVNIFNSAITENITLSEAIDKQAILFASISESSTATAIQGAQAVFTGQLSESVTASSLESATVALNATIAEQISASDLAIPTVIFSVAIVEPVTATETQDRTAVLFASRAESATATDTQSATTAFNVIRSESTTIDIIQSVTFAANASATELMQVTDSPYAAMYKLLEILAAKQHVLSAEPYVYNVSASPVVGSVTPIVEDSGIQVTAEVIYPTIH